ncbi:MAG: cupin domain-containing protein, partial [Bacteroidetes bacterium]|nr:cupin domain-containing protein [Bacteroidota bacterium]
MMTRVEHLISALHLIPHPEGGWYREIYRANEKLEKIDRNLMTSIYFLITSENVSKFHEIKSDELWFFHEGTGLTVHVLDKNDHYSKLSLGLDISKGQMPQGLVEAGKIFGSTVDDENGYA